MAKMWAGRTDGITDQIADDFNSSIHFDCRMYREDITGSMAHAAMLARQNIIPKEASEHIISGLKGILADLDSGKLKIDMTCEDIHMFVEQVLTERIGEEGKMLHTARSRNDQVALDFRMNLRTASADIRAKIASLMRTLCTQAESSKDVIVPGYTHLQRAQPVTFGHHLMAYAMMLERDLERLSDMQKRLNICPIGCCALAGTTYDTDRYYEAELLGFEGISMNSMDGVSDRDFALEMLSALSILMMHLSRLSEELILWTSWEFRFITLDDAYTTGSSIMPQKKNSDMAELIRGKTGRVYGDMMGLFATMKSLPLAYNKDMQEDKEPVFDAIDQAVMSLQVMQGMIATMHVHPENMKKAAQQGFINATDLADYLTAKGMPFRTAYRISGQIVAACIAGGMVLETMPLSEYRKYSSLFENDVYEAIDLTNCVNRRTSEGGTSVPSVEKQIAWIRERTENVESIH